MPGPRFSDETTPPADPLAVTAEPAGGTAPHSPVSWPPGSSRRSRLVAGAIVGGRYRIVTPLGRGGMGEVFRADDLELGQSVALKFLPDHLADDPVALDRLRGEVRTARQIAHPNVCRVYDIGSDGRDYFLTMEFVDGEDLASVLRRLGPPGREKSLELARQICAGLNAAHEQGVLHRDLKPANIMLDGRGRARITDFGLAALAADLAGRRAAGGTPAYMAPEQLMRGEVSVQSDLYALGLVLLELFTGRSPNAGKSIEQLLQTRTDAQMSQTISTLAPDLDPAIERVVEQCLAVEAKQRPRSAMDVVAALPGGDPIAAALAAGEVPSPQLIAASGAQGYLPISPAVGLLLLAIAGVLVFVAVAGRTRLVNHVPLSKSPEVLAERAREVIRKLGYTAPPRDWASGFEVDNGHLLHLVHHGPHPDRFASLSKASPPALFYWYRQSPQVLIPRTATPSTEAVSWANPPNVIPGGVNVMLAPDGRLHRLVAVPPRFDDAPTDPPATRPAPADFAVPLREAGFDPATLTPQAPRYAPTLPFDERYAWSGAFPGSDTPAVIEAGAYRGRLTYLLALAPWELPGYRSPVSGDWFTAFAGLLQVVVLVGTSVLITVNLAQRRGDHRGAYRLAVCVFLFYQASYLLTLARLQGFFELTFPQFWQSFAFALLTGSLAWALYMGLEPILRRRSPYRLVSWSRLLEGRARDPLVGRDLLLGLACSGAGLVVVSLLTLASAPWTQPTPPVPGALFTLGSTRQLWAVILSALLNGLIGAMVFLILPLILQVVLRSWLLAIAVFWLCIAAIIGSSGYERTIVGLVASACIWAACLFPLYRFGVLAGAAAIFSSNLLANLPVAGDLTAWYATPTLMGAAVVIALAAWGFHLATGGFRSMASAVQGLART